jgi:RNA polymerase sigma-70 factor, ECF subfamily
MVEAQTDEALMLRYRDGDANAFELLYVRHKGALYRYFLRQCHQPAVAEELFQDVWMNLIRARERYEVRAKFTTYLFNVAHNRLIDYYRRQSSGVPLAYDDDPEDPIVDRLPGGADIEPHNAVERGQQAQRLMQALAALPEAQREAFLLREEAGLSIEEIASATGVNMETAKSRLRYAVAKLKRTLVEEMERQADGDT